MSYPRKKTCGFCIENLNDAPTARALETATEMWNFETLRKGMIVCEPTLKAADFFGSAVVPDLAVFKARADLIVANRYSPDLADVTAKVYTRDLFARD